MDFCCFVTIFVFLNQFNPLVIQPQAMTQQVWGSFVDNLLQVSINNVPTALSIRLLVMLGVFMLVAFLHLLMNRSMY